MEHKIEKERGREYIKSFREDLCKDTAILRQGIEFLKVLSTDGDTLVKIIHEGDFHSPAELKRLYEYNISALAGFGLSLTDRTETQLKNSGGMRLITKKEVIDGIIDYWAGGKAISAIETIVQEMRVKARDQSYRIFDSKYYLETNTGEKREVAANAQLVTKDPVALIEFGNRIAHYKNLMKGTYSKNLKRQMDKADTLIQIIDKVYHLK